MRDRSRRCMCFAFLLGAFLAGRAYGSGGALPAIGGVPAPVTADLSHIVAAREGPLSAEAFSIYRWDRFPTVLILDMADFEAQNRMFSRLAFYLEKVGFRGRLLTNAQLKGKHGWNAHDYGAEGLAAFFEAADRAHFRLNPEELLLEDIALREGILLRTGGSVAAGQGGVLSISRASSLYERRLLLAHESYHGVFFASPEYQRFCFDLWDAATADERRFMVALLAVLGYDSSDRYLSVNEFQAYLLQQPSSMAAAYFRRVASLLADSSDAPGVEQALPGLLDDEKKLEGFLQTHFAMTAGGAYSTAEAQ